MAKVLTVDDVRLTLAKSNPPHVIVDAMGRVSSSGWTHPTLDPYTYFIQPPDGILDFDFNAMPPDGIALTVIRPISATTSFVLPRWVKGVRVHAANGEPKVAMLYDEAHAASDKSQLSSDPGGWIISGKAQPGGDIFPWLIASENAS